MKFFEIFQNFILFIDIILKQYIVYKKIIKF